MKRYIGLDVHKEFTMIAIVNKVQETLLPPFKVKMERFDKWIAENITEEDTVALESSNGCWEIYDRLSIHTSNVLVANTTKLKMISNSSVKTDKHDAMVLAKLTSVNMLPSIWVPPVEVRELRSLVAQRKRQINMRTRAKNRMHGILMRRHIRRPMKEAFRDQHVSWWQSLPLTKVEKLQIKQGLEQIEFLNKQISEIEEYIAELSTQSPWKEQAAYIMQMVGIGLISTMTILAAIGNITRFPTDKKLVGYSGLGSRVYASGGTYRTGKICKQGRKELRTALVECAWVAVGHSDYWKEEYKRLTTRKKPNKAITIIARKMLVVIWHVLTKKTVDRNTTAEGTARKLMKWASTYRIATKQGLSRPAFVRQELDRLGIGVELNRFKYGSKYYKLPASSLSS